MSASSVPPDQRPLEPTEHDPRPVVAVPRQGVPGAAIAGIAIILALVLFLVLDAQRRRGVPLPRSGADRAGVFSPPPPLAIPLEPAPAPARVTIVTSAVPQVPLRVRSLPSLSPPPPPARPPALAPLLQPLPQPPEPAPFPAAQVARPRLNEPALVLDTGTEAQAGSGSATGPAAQGGPAGAQGRSSAGGDDAPVRATVIRNQTTIMPVGTLIPAVLETPIDTARPGLLRAIVSHDTPGFDGRRVLVPRGSRLIGEYQSDVRSGQNRVLVTWTRLIRPDGVAIRLGSPAADQLGGAGIPGRVNTFFFQRFASAVLQSALTIGVNLASRPREGSVVVGVPTGPITAIGQGLLPGNDLRPKITVKQGTALNVFVARDLDFSGTGSRPQ